MTMAIKRRRPLIRLAQWFRRKRNMNYAFKQAQKEARRFARDVNRRNRAQQKRENKLTVPVILFLLSLVAFSATLTHVSTKWGIQ